jgi:hypothetical protein
MDRSRFGAGGATLGAGVLATCLCSTTEFALGRVALAGFTASLNLHAALVLLAAAFAIGGLLTRSPLAAARATLGFTMLAAGYVLGPPAVMTRTTEQSPARLVGFGFTLVGVGLVVWA